MSDYTAGIIGCGRMSEGHAHAYASLGIPIIAAADIAEESRERARNYGARRVYDDFRRMLDDATPDIISVATGEQVHCEIVVEAASRGVNGIVCEKPMAMNLAEARHMLDACRASGTKLTISHQRIYEPQYAEAIRLIADGAIGEVRFAEALAMAPSIHTDGTHTIHMLLALLGEPTVERLIGQIDGNSDYSYYGHRCDHAGNAFIAFTDGRYAHLTWGLRKHGENARLHPRWDPERHFYQAYVAHGETGRLELDGDSYAFRRGEERPRLLRIVRDGKEEDCPFEWPIAKSFIAREVEALIDSIETGAEHPLRGETGYATLEVIMGIYESSRRRGVVEFPVQAQDNPFLAMFGDS